MIEELKELLSVVSSLPHLALWAAGGFLLYKLAIMASVYGTIRFVVQRLYDFKVHPKVETIAHSWSPGSSVFFFHKEGREALEQAFNRFLMKHVRRNGIDGKFYVYDADTSKIIKALDEVVVESPKP